MDAILKTSALRHWWGIQGDVHPHKVGHIVDRMDVLIAGLVLLAVDAAAAISLGICRADFNYDAMPSSVIEHNVGLRIPEGACQLW